MQGTLGTRQQRREAILALVQARPIRRQAEFQRLLSQQGIDANQATLSRDLRDLGLVKGPKGYELPHAPAAPSAQATGTPGLQLRNAVREWLLSLRIAGNLVVLRTPPSGASPLALALDQVGEPALLGTIAGDDTVLVICASAAAGKRLVKSLRGMQPGPHAQ